MGVLYVPGIAQKFIKQTLPKCPKCNVHLDDFKYLAIQDKAWMLLTGEYKTPEGTDLYMAKIAQFPKNAPGIPTSFNSAIYQLIDPGME